MSPPDWHIALPPPPCLPERLRSSDPDSPALSFHTPPSSPLISPDIFYTPPSSPMQPDPPIHTDDPFPVVMDVALDLALDDEGLTTLEKIYLYSRSRAAFHRVFIAHALPAFLTHVTPQEAVEYVLPLLSGLAMDDGQLCSYLSHLSLIFRPRRICQGSFGRRTCPRHLVVFLSSSSLCNSFLSLSHSLLYVALSDNTRRP
jgi:hypothetical protein